MTEIFTASTLEDAKQKAAEAFGVPLSEIQFTVLDEPKHSLFGGLFGKKESEYRVQADYTPQPDIPQAAPAETAPSAPPESVSADSADAVPAVEAAAVSVADEPESSDQPVVVPMEIQLQKMEAGIAYVRQVLAQLAPNVTCEGKIDDNGIVLTLSGEEAGVVIGRRGSALDALQYLTSIVANRGDSDYVRLTIDTCGYRDQRIKALQALAQRVSKEVLRTHRSVALEAMNPFERRIIHSTVTEIEGVSSMSVGEEPYRKVIIKSDAAPAYKQREERNPRNYRQHGGRYDKSERGGDRGRGRRQERRPSGEGPRKLDLSTSFEKDYKRPKPEDALNTGVYGKIDI